MKGYMCPDCHGITGNRCKICNGQGWIEEIEYINRAYKKKYGLWGTIKRLFGK